MAQYELLIHARRAVVDDRIQQAAVTVDGGVISSVRTGSEARDIGLAGDHTIALGDDVVLMPGLVDPHVSTEDVAVGTRSAAQGGITSVIDYGTDGDPVAITPEDVDRWRQDVSGESTVDVGLWGAAVPGNLGGLGTLLDRGVFGVSAVAAGKGVAGAPTLDSAQVVAAAEEVAEAGGLFAVDAGVDDLPGLLEVCRRTGGRLHVRAVSDHEELPLLREARADGLAVTCDTAPPYFDLNETAIGDFRTYAKLSPPLRPDADRRAVCAALADGTVDAVASARLGLSVVWTEARRRGFDLADVAGWMATRTAGVVGLRDRGEIRVGLRADLAAVADDDAFVVLPGTRELGSADSVYAQRALAGVVRWTMRGGTVIDPRALALGTVLTRQTK